MIGANHPRFARASSRLTLPSCSEARQASRTSCLPSLIVKCLLSRHRIPLQLGCEVVLYSCVGRLPLARRDQFMSSRQISPSRTSELHLNDRATAAAPHSYQEWRQSVPFQKVAILCSSRSTLRRVREPPAHRDWRTPASNFRQSRYS